MSENQDNGLERLITFIGYWGWAHKFSRFDNRLLIIGDQPFLNRLNEGRKIPLACAMATPATYRKAVTRGIRQVLVFCEENELPIVRELQQKYPNKMVVSGSYGYALTGPDRQSKMQAFEYTSWPKINDSTVILTTPYADGEYLATLMSGAGLASCYEYLAKPYISWLAWTRHFQPARFFSVTASRFAEGGRLDWLFQTDVLEALFANTSLSRRRFVSHLCKTGAKVIFVRRRDKVAQAALAQVLDRTGERSVWTRMINKGFQVQYREDDFAGSLDMMSRIVNGERLQDELAKALDQTMTVYLEDIIRDPGAAIAEVAGLLGTDATSVEAPLPYVSGFKKSEAFALSYQDFRRDFIDGIGLHVGPIFPG